MLTFFFLSNEWMFGHIHLYSFFFQILQACYNQWKNMFFLIFCWFSYITSHPYPIHSFKTEPYSLSLWFWFFYFVTGFHCLLTLLHFISFIQLLSVKSSSSSSLSILALTTILINDDDDDVDIQIGEGKKTKFIHFNQMYWRLQFVYGVCVFCW